MNEGLETNSSLNQELDQTDTEAQFTTGSTSNNFGRRLLWKRPGNRKGIRTRAAELALAHRLEIAED